MWTMPRFSGGNTELTAEMLDTVIEYLRRQGRIVPSPEVAVDQTPDGWVLRLVTGLGMWGRLDEADGDRWGWTQVELAANGRFVPHPSGRVGTPDSQWAVEANGLAARPGTVVWLEPAGDADGRMTFGSPVAQASDRSVFWAEIIDSSAGSYGYRPLVMSGGGFQADPAGRVTTADQSGAAVEATGLTSVPVGSVVLMFDFGDANGEPLPSTSVAFRYGSAAAPVWGKLSGRTTNTLYTVSLGTVAGTWTATVTDNVSGAAYTAKVPADASAQTVQDQLSAALNLNTAALGLPYENLVRVSEGTGSTGAGGPYVVEFLGRLGGGRDVTLAVEGGESQPTAEKTQAGKDDPYTDGKGAYGWYEVEFDDSSPTLVRPKSGGLSSDWPYGAAYEAGGETDVPAGSVVRIYPGPSVALAGRDAPDQRYLFRFQGEVGRWAVTGTAARWRVDLGNPTAGLWVLKWDDGGKNAVALKRSTALTFGALDTHTSATINWNQSVPTRKFVSGQWTTQAVTTAGPTVPLPADATQIHDALVAAYPMLAGNLSVTGGPLGTFTTSVNNTDPCNPVTVKTPVTVTVALSGDLAECGNTSGFTVSLGGTGYPGPTTAVVGQGSRYLYSYDAFLATIPLGGFSETLPTADWGVVACRSTTPPQAQDGNESFFRSTYAYRNPFYIDAAGYDGDHDLPAVSIASFLKYGDDGTAAGTPTVGREPVPGPPVGGAVGAASAHRGRGVYYATLLAPSDQPALGGVEVPLVPALTDTRLTVVSAVEANGRPDIPARAVVRLWTSGRADRAPGAADAVAERWCFQGPPTGFFAVVQKNDGGGRYEVVPALSAWARLRHVTADELSGNLSVPTGSYVWVEPSADGDHFVMVPHPFDSLALVIYDGPPGVFPSEPAANGHLFIFSGIPSQVGVVGDVTNTSQKCVVSTDGYPLTAGAVYAGLKTGGVPAAGGGTIPTYSVESPLQQARAGVPGGPSDVGQVLAGGDKVIWGGIVSWGPTPLAGPPAGESIPAGGRWGCTSTASSMFSGSTALDGARWGFRASGPSVAREVVQVGVPTGRSVASSGLLVNDIGTGDTTIRVSVPTYVNTGRLVPATPFPIAVGSGSNPYEVMTVTKVCNVSHAVDPTDTQTDFTVTRAQNGTTARPAAAGSGWATIVIVPAGTLMGPARTTFWTDRAAFSHNGVVGGAGAVTIPGVNPTNDYTLTFAGGLQTAVVAGSNMFAYGPYANNNMAVADQPGTGSGHSGATVVTFTGPGGLINSVQTLP